MFCVAFVRARSVSKAESVRCVESVLRIATQVRTHALPFLLVFHFSSNTRFETLCREASELEARIVKSSTKSSSKSKKSDNNKNSSNINDDDDRDDKTKNDADGDADGDGDGKKSKKKKKKKAEEDAEQKLIDIDDLKVRVCVW